MGERLVDYYNSGNIEVASARMLIETLAADGVELSVDQKNLIVKNLENLYAASKLKGERNLAELILKLSARDVFSPLSDAVQQHLEQYSAGVVETAEAVMKNRQRIGKDEYYISIAEAVLQRSTCLRRRYGAVIVKDDEIISTGYNGSPRGEKNCIDIGYCNREHLNIPKGQRYEECVAVHAEQNACLSARRSDLIGSTIYIAGREVKTWENADPTPCKLCNRTLKNAGIARVVGTFKNSVFDIKL